jgi:hypothetical protein
MLTASQFFRVKTDNVGGITPGNLPQHTQQGSAIPDRHLSILNLAGKR